jgi:hypothetical protein
MAKAFYNQRTHSYDADAAGTHVAEVGQTLLERKATSSSKNFFVLDVMKDTPQWLLESPKYVYWDVKDPRGQNYETTAQVRDDIRRRVQQLIK